MARFDQVSNAYIDSVVRSLSDALIVIDSRGRIRTVNQATLDLLGYEKKELLGKKIDAVMVVEKEEELIIFKDGVALESLEFLDKDFIHDHEVTYLTKDGKDIPMSLSASVMRDLDGRLVGITTLARDMTDRKKAEEEIRRYAKELEEMNHLKDLFTDVMRHDLLSPLSVIQNVSGFLDDENDEDREKYAEMISESATKMMKIIEDATSLAKIESAEEIGFEDLELGAMLKASISSIAPLAEVKGISVEFEADDGRYPVNANTILEEVFDNLLSNAVKYSPEGSKVEAGIEDGEHAWKVSFKDSGEGIPDDYKEEIFERFMRTHKGGVKGSGLGLAITKKVVELHKGRVWVENNPEGQGSIFYVTLPKG